MSYHVVTKHLQNLSFDSNVDGHSILMDASVAGGGDDRGASPKKLLLSALAGCTGIDVVSLLKKMRVPFSDFEIVTNAELTEEHPRVFSNIELIYRIKVEEKHRDKVEKAVNLSEEKYCGVSAMLKKNSPIEFRIEFL
ncbi:MAG: OsmC family protein [Saprospiraceae bacterium]|nr:OsmC family protein [Saprospiraceae bacterium]